MINVNLTNKETIFETIRDWEYDAGESFLDYFDSNIKINTLMIWAWGRKYISVEQWNLYEEALFDRESFFISASDVLEGYECPYAITSDEDWEKGRMILAEFISESDIYKRRLERFIKEYYNPEEYDEKPE